MPARTGTLEDWEIALIKAMWASGDFSKQAIQAHFTSPERSVNQGRITEIATGRRHASVPPATEEQLTRFLENWRERDRARLLFRQSDPFHDANLASLLRLSRRRPPILATEESEMLEYKENYSWASRSRYARTMAAFANRAGGYLLFGVRNATREVIGIGQGVLQVPDTAEVSRYLSQRFSPALRWARHERQLAGAVVGLIYTWPADAKPVVCSSQDAELRESDIYYRYAGETARIRFPELAALLSERDRRVEQRLLQVTSRAREIGVDNLALLDTDRGVLEGARDSFTVDRSLLDQLRIVREGDFHERDGAPALRLVGTLEPVGGERIIERRTTLSDEDLIADFVAQREVSDPENYVRHLVHARAKWLPVYYFIHRAGACVEDAVDAIRAVPTTRRDHREQCAARVLGLDAPTGLPSRAAQSDAREEILRREPVDVALHDDARRFLRAVCTMTAAEIVPDHVLPLLYECFSAHYHDGPPWLTSLIRYASAHVDLEVFGRTAARRVGGEVTAPIVTAAVPAEAVSAT